MIPAAARPVAMAGGERTEARSPLAQLLHALNQPLTGLQCSMEVALASPRTVEQYVQGLREGLQLTERMRALVEAMREVTDFEPEKETEETTELISLLRETVRDLEPVAQTKDVRLSLDSASGSSSSSLLSSSLSVRVGRARLAVLLFRLLDAALSLAERGTALRIDAGSEPNLVDQRSVASRRAAVRILPAGTGAARGPGRLRAQRRRMGAGADRRWGDGTHRPGRGRRREFPVAGEILIELLFMARPQRGEKDRRPE